MKHAESNRHRPYLRLLVMTAGMFAAMYLLMYAMVDRFANVYPNFNQVYMAALMTAPMVLLELLAMRTMYPDRKRNLVIGVTCLLVGISSWALIRGQGAIGDRQFLRSMIPHHAAALLMCQQASIESPAIQDLCRRILASQQAEIDEMKGLLEK